MADREISEDDTINIIDDGYDILPLHGDTDSQVHRPRLGDQTNLVTRTRIYDIARIQSRDFVSTAIELVLKVWWSRLPVGLHTVFLTTPHPLSVALDFKIAI